MPMNHDVAGGPETMADGHGMEAGFCESFPCDIKGGLLRCVEVEGCMNSFYRWDHGHEQDTRRKANECVAPGSRHKPGLFERKETGVFMALSGFDG